MNVKLAFKAFLWPLSICVFVALIVVVGKVGAWMATNLSPMTIVLGFAAALFCYVWRMAYVGLKAKAENEAYYKANPGRGADYR
jgi:uncharacterized membrane protein (DUF485 family)